MPPEFESRRAGKRDRRGYSATPSVSPIIIQSLRRRVDRVARRMAIEMARTIPLGEGFAGGSAFGSEVLAACKEGVGTMLSLWAESRPPSQAELQQLSRMGGRLASTGVPLDAILRAYRVAALVIWQHVIDAVRIHPEIEAQSVLTAVGPLFDYLDAISVAVSTSYLETRERLRREQDRQYDQFFSDVLGGTADLEMVARAADGGTVLEFPYRLVVVGADDVSAEATIATAWMVVGAHVALYQSTVVALVPGLTKVGTLERLLQVAVGSDRAPWQMAVGPIVTSLGEVPLAVRAARDALTVGQALMPERQVFDTAKLHPYLAWVHDLDGLREFVEGALGPLLERERNRSLPLRQTLEAVLNHDGLSAAARALGVHRHTLLYRMERIEDLVGEWSDSEDRLRLELALRGSRLLDALTPADVAKGNQPRQAASGRA
ncbi:MAG TPA: helix-turn-helix domain-containing protein [Candidatus Dormibacteraeota bacterium]